MLEIKNIRKVYEVDDFKQEALKDVSITFRQNEFVSILGPSGSGKTTLLNIIGGLDDYTSGDLIISGISTKKYTIAIGIHIAIIVLVLYSKVIILFLINLF